ncbi:MAG TPA: hypothetical protein VGD29_30270 [Actinoplanes sp.]
MFAGVARRLETALRGLDGLLDRLGPQGIDRPVRRERRPPRRNRVLRVERRIGRLARGERLERDYQRTTGRTPSSGRSVVALIAGA